VNSDRTGEKLAFLADAVAAGYNVVLCFIGVANPDTSEERIAMRVSQGGHDVPPEKLITRFPALSQTSGPQSKYSPKF
jgi:predicted ABC-type ATPase